MITVPSDLHLQHFAVLQSHYEFIPPKGKAKDLQKYAAAYEVDIDFAHKENDDNTIQVFTKIEVNQIEKPLPGYRLFVEGTGVFTLAENEEMAETARENLKFLSTVNILIGYLRNTLMAMTASAPMGPFLLQPINMGDLLRKKSERSNGNQ